MSLRNYINQIKEDFYRGGTVFAFKEVYKSLRDRKSESMELQSPCVHPVQEYFIETEVVDVPGIPARKKTI